jgi:hypothetical protein
VLGAVAFVALVYGFAVLAATGLQQVYLAWRDGTDVLFDLAAAYRLPRGEQQTLFIAIQLASQLIELALIFLLVERMHRSPRVALGLAPVRLGIGGWIGVIALVFAVKLVATLFATGLAPSSPRDDVAPFVELVRSPLTWAFFLVTVVLAGATEELLFRGVLSRTLERTRLGFWGGAGLASAAFAILHTQYGVGGQIVVFAIGMALAWIRASTGSLWPAIVCHSVNNAVALLVMRAIG